MTADGVELTDMWVVDYKDGAIVQQLHQSNTDDNWGAPTMSLTLGTHHIYFLASRGQNPTYTNGVVTWTKPLDAFYLDYEVVVVKTSNGNRAVTLNRVATKMDLHINDAIPAGTTTISITPTTWYTGWNMLTATPVAAPSNYSVTLNIPKSYEGFAGAYISAWSLSTADEWTTDISIESKAGETVNASALIEHAPFKANRATIYRGNLYTNSSENSVTLQTEWLTSYEDVY